MERIDQRLDNRKLLRAHMCPEFVDRDLRVRHGQLPLELQEIPALILLPVVCKMQMDHHAGAVPLVVVTKAGTEITQIHSDMVPGGSVIRDRFPDVGMR